MIEVLLLLIIAILVFGAGAVVSRVAGFLGYVGAVIVLAVIAANMGISGETALYAVLSVPFLLLVLLPIIKLLEHWSTKRFEKRLEGESRNHTPPRQKNS